MAVFTAFNLVLLVIVFIAYKIWIYVIKVKNLPPGPFSLPLIGSLSVYARKLPLPQMVDKLSKKYGDIMTVWVGGRPVVILSSLESVRAAFIDNQHDFASRPDSVPFMLMGREGGGIFTEKYNSAWKRNKKLVARAIRSMVDTSLLEDVVHTGMQESLEALSAQAVANKPVNLFNYLSNIVYNVIYKFCFGHGFKLEDPEFLRLISMSLDINSAWGKALYIDEIPYVHRLPLSILSFFPHVGQLSSVIDDYHKFFGEHVKKHKESYKTGICRDILDSMYQQSEIMKKEGETVPFHSFRNVIFEIFSAGTDTTAYTLLWFFLCLIQYPEVQEKCYEEVNQVIGKRTPRLQDRQNMPYFEAALLETLRYRPMAPMGLAHFCDSDKQLMGYTIPRGADININTLALHKDPKIWSNPDNYDPNNFLNTDGTVFRPPNFLTFGAGRRACLGENLAKNDLFLIAAGLIQKLQFLPVPDVAYSDVQSEMVETFAIPLPYEVLVKIREE